MHISAKFVTLDYNIKKFPKLADIESIAKQWNNDDFQIVIDISVGRISFTLISILTIFTYRIGFQAGIRLNLKFYSDDSWHQQLQLSFNANLTIICVSIFFN